MKNGTHRLYNEISGTYIPHRLTNMLHAFDWTCILIKDCTSISKSSRMYASQNQCKQMFCLTSYKAWNIDFILKLMWLTMHVTCPNMWFTCNTTYAFLEDFTRILKDNPDTCHSSIIDSITKRDLSTSQIIC